MEYSVLRLETLSLHEVLKADLAILIPIILITTILPIIVIITIIVSSSPGVKSRPPHRPAWASDTEGGGGMEVDQGQLQGGWGPGERYVCKVTNKQNYHRAKQAIFCISGAG